MTITQPARSDFTLTWILDAPAADVFQAWTDPEHLDWFYNDSYAAPADGARRVAGRRSTRTGSTIARS